MLPPVAPTPCFGALLARFAVFAGVVLVSCASSAVDFQRDIQPIFAESCYKCHGPEKHKSGLRLDRKADALAGGDSGAVIVPRDLAKSLIVEHITSTDPDTVMPPESEGKPLTPAQIALIKTWIEEGAVWPDEADDAKTAAASNARAHWAFKPIVRPEVPRIEVGPVVPNAPPPDVRSPQNGGLRITRPISNPIDAFILAELAKRGIAPSPEADRATLLRRLSFDLLGLPPTPEQVRAFAADARPDAYERIVDQLLASPHFGERWGRHWLDLARYADSDGYEKDSPRPYAYLYRDWVIDAINRDLPFDRFTIEQLAGDLLPAATKEQKIATGFHRQTLINREGGVDQEEFRSKAVVDRVSTTGTVWLGLTVGCAECHSHKYDPITQREFYQLFAFFNNADDEELPAPHPEEVAKYERAKAAWEKEYAPVKKAFDDYVREVLPAKQAEWESAGKLELALWKFLAPESTKSATGATLEVQKDRSVAASGMNPLVDTYTLEANAPQAAITGFRLEVLTDMSAKNGPGRSGNGNFVLSEFSVAVHSPNDGTSRVVALKNPSADFSQKDYAVAGAIDGDPKTGWAVAPQTKQRHVAVFECAEPLTLAPGARLVFTLDQQFGNQHTIGRFRISATTSAAPLKPSLADDLVVVAWQKAPEARNAKEKTALTAYFRDEIDPGATQLRKPLQNVAKKEPKYPETKAAVMAERAAPRETHVHVRGDFLRLGPRVEPATPAFLPKVAQASRLHGSEKAGGASALLNRLDLANWLVDEANPLTRRVTVNHVWKNLFGRGLVGSVNDFGTRGEMPTHPELLDWLATEFSQLGWSRKALIKLIVMSATYRQSSAYRDDLIEVDPLNTLLARQNRLRLEAENVRDAHLMASGLLAPKIGGPSVRPPLPADIAALGYANSVKWKESEGADRYRRGMYIFFQRTVPYPMLMTFDAPDANATCTRRERSNTPLQALTLWNDPVFFDCARALAKELTREPTVEARIERAFERCLSRPPSAAEMARLRTFYDEQLRMTRETPKSAAAILGLEGDSALPSELAEQATLVATVRTIMNLDEFITRE